MRTKEEGHAALRKLVRKASVVNLEALYDALETRSRMSVFRRLREVGYFTSFTHRGRYYTLHDIPRFDERGLWFFRDVGFSREGTLKETVSVQIEDAPEGQTHEDLRSRLRVRVYNTLLALVREARIGRERIGTVYLYVSADGEKAAQQVARRRELVAVLAEALRVLTDEEVIEVLVETLRAAPAVPDPDRVAQCLVARGMRLESHHVEQIYKEHGLVPEKKTAPPSSRRLPR